MTNKQTKNAADLIKKNLGKITSCGDTYPFYKWKLGKLSAGVEIIALENTKPATIQTKANNKKIIICL